MNALAVGLTEIYHIRSFVDAIDVDMAKIKSRSWRPTKTTTSCGNPEA
jgi:hypothetical protein